MAIERKCGTCAYHNPGPDSLSGTCSHPLRQGAKTIDLFVRHAELACRTFWGDDCWTSDISTRQIDLKIWGPFLPGDLVYDGMPVDLIDWLVRNSESRNP